MRTGTTPSVPGNRWDTLTVPTIGDWTPELRVSVIIPAHNCQPTLDLTLASLCRQSYPSELIEVVVVDDGSDPPIELPKLVPDNCRIVTVQDREKWGPSNARHVGALESTGDILHWLDSDMVVFPEHIEAQARWHHVVPYAVVLGHKRFVREGWTTPDEVLERAVRGDLAGLFPAEATDPHEYVEKIINGSRDLRDGDHLIFRAHVTATASVRRELYLAAGGFDTELHLGEDTELGYRLAQAGALFVPERESRSWHMGASHMMRLGPLLRRHNEPYLAERIPQLRWLRKAGGRWWNLPLVTAVVDAGDHAFELVRTCVDHLLASDEQDLRVLLVGSWAELADTRRDVLHDPALDRRLIAAYYRSDPRVTLVETAPESVFPSPYRLDVPPTAALGPATVGRLVREADHWRVGLVRVLTGEQPTDSVDLWRTAAVGRARFHVDLHDRAAVAESVARTHGLRWVSGVSFDVRDLSTVPLEELRSPPRHRPALKPADGGAKPDGDTPANRDRERAAPPPRTDVVAVAGFRSLVRAARYVARLAVSRAWRRIVSAWRKVVRMRVR